ncbi:MAG: ATP-binding protein [Planctomycetota bacterium]
MPSLFVIQGYDQGKRFELETPRVSIGRDAGNELQLHDTEVSRQHAEIREDEDGNFELVDLGSSNGSFVNSTRVTNQPLHSGDRLQVGSTLMIFTASDADQANDVLDHVDITSSQVAEESRIIKSLKRDVGALTSGPQPKNAWLARAKSNLEIMYRTALAVSHTLDIDQLLVRIMELIFEWVEADRGCVMLVQKDTKELIPKVRRNRPGVQTGDKMSISRTILDYVLQNHEGVLTSDAREDQRFDAARSIVKLGVREAICVPMQGRYGIVGLIYIDTYIPPGQLLRQGNRNKFSEEHLQLMIAIGHQAALAVEDTSYYSAMVQAERLAAIGQTIAGLSHHVKNILQGIQGGSYLIEEGLNNDAPDVVRKGWGIVERNQEKISRLVLDMLTFSKERQPEMVPQQVQAVVADVTELMRGRAQEGCVELRVEENDAIPELTFDPEGIHHALLNVVTNAIDACAEQTSGRVDLRLAFDPDNQCVSISVTDNGKGIPKEDLDRVFNFFVSSKGHRGTGLGLAVTQKILREHGGDIKVTSELGKGSTFTLTFQASPVAPSSTVPPSLQDTQYL